MKKAVSEIVILAVMILSLPAFLYFSWNVDRWINWTFSYGPEINSRYDVLNNDIENVAKEVGGLKRQVTQLQIHIREMEKAQ